MTAVESARGVREYVAEDLERLAPVYLPLHANDKQSPAAVKAAYDKNFPRLFRNPLDPTVDSPSLVYEEDGEIHGMVAVASRPFLLEGERVTGSVTTVLVVTEQGSRSLAGVRLLREVFDGPQDFTFTDQSNVAGRRTLRASGALNLPSYSLRWVKSLRPGAAKARGLAKRMPAGIAPSPETLLERYGRYEGQLPDRLRSRAIAALPDPPEGLRRAPLTVDDVVTHGPGLFAPFDLHPDVRDEATVRWQWDLLDIGHSPDRLAKVAVWSKRDKLLGWYLLHVDAEGTGEVIQIVAGDESMERVLTLLFHDARAMGAITVRGDVAPHLVFALSDLGCTFRTRVSATSVHSRNDDIVDAFRRGSAFISGLEGEGPLNPAYTTNDGR